MRIIVSPSLGLQLRKRNSNSDISEWRHYARVAEQKSEVLSVAGDPIEL
jgi:hypothetical protein